MDLPVDYLHEGGCYYSLYHGSSENVIGNLKFAHAALSN